MQIIFFSSGGIAMGVRVTSKEHAIETARDRPAAAKKDGDRLAVSLTHPSPCTHDFWLQAQYVLDHFLKIFTAKRSVMTI
jgi:hypothetical protein